MKHILEFGRFYYNTHTCKIEYKVHTEIRLQTLLLHHDTCCFSEIGVYLEILSYTNFTSNSDFILSCQISSFIVHDCIYNWLTVMVQVFPLLHSRMQIDGKTVNIALVSCVIRILLGVQIQSNIGRDTNNLYPIL